MRYRSIFLAICSMMQGPVPFSVMLPVCKANYCGRFLFISVFSIPRKEADTLQNLHHWQFDLYGRGRWQRYLTCCSIEPAQPMHTIGVIYRSVLALQLGTRTSFLIFFSINFLQVFDLPHHIQYKFLFFGYGLSFFSITGFFFHFSWSFTE